MHERQKVFNDSGHGGGERPKDAVSGGTNYESQKFWILESPNAIVTFRERNY